MIAANFNFLPKGLEIYGLLNSPKNWTTKFDFTTWIVFVLPTMNCFRDLLAFNKLDH